MGFLDKAEARIENTIVSMFSKLSKKQLQPIEISQAVKNAMDVAATAPGRDRKLVPHRYLIKLSPQDKDNLSDQLLRAISSEVANHAGQKSYQLTGELGLKVLWLTKKLHGGRIQVGSAAVSSLVSWKPMVSYGDQRLELSSGTTSFGRDASADVAIDDRGLSPDSL